MNIDSASATSTAIKPVITESIQQATRAPIKSSSAQAASEQAGSGIPVRRNQEEAPSRQSVEESVDRLAKFVRQNQSDINFSIDESSGIRVVKIIDRSSNEVIRQMPSEEAVALAQALDKLQGLLIRDKA